MEETNYSRHSFIGVAPIAVRPEQASVAAKMNEKCARPDNDVASEDDLSTPIGSFKSKTYLDKLKLWQEADLQKDNHIAGMTARPLIFLTFPGNSSTSIGKTNSKY